MCGTHLPGQKRPFTFMDNGDGNLLTRSTQYVDSTMLSEDTDLGNHSKMSSALDLPPRPPSSSGPSAPPPSSSSSLRATPFRYCLHRMSFARKKGSRRDCVIILMYHFHVSYIVSRTSIATGIAHIHTYIYTVEWRLLEFQGE